MARKLKDDVRALGGDDDDVAMLQDVDSDAELPVASSSKKDVRFVRRAGAFNRLRDSVRYRRTCKSS